MGTIERRLDEDAAIAPRYEAVAPSVASPLQRAARQRPIAAIAYAVVLTLLFVHPLASLAAYAANTSLDSHIVLVPFVVVYLLYTGRARLPHTYRTSLPGAVTFAVIGVVALAGRFMWAESLSRNDELALVTLAFEALLVAGAFAFLGSRWLSAAAFPVAFLLFMVPLPDAVVDWLERGFMLASAEAAAMYFNIVGIPVVRHGTVFELPGVALRVAQECSGIRSSWVLFITSLLASHLFLDRPWRRLVLVAFVIPLGILRNGLRILVIGLLCVHIGPQMIDSVVHRRGGPLFFALSLVPLFLLVWWLRRSEQRGQVS